ncbi:MAG: hypothetical protein PHO02_03165 [Candidatus Nanoarchaeia archaeon]|nr:hypothetical protein [Candidatus Nanoarchaeia archaeon]
MDMTYKIILAVIAGLVVFYIMKTMTKWAFRIIIVILFIAGLFYMYGSIDDMKAIFNEEMKEPAESISSVNITETNITEGRAGEEALAASELPAESQPEPGAEALPESAEPVSA